MRNFYEILGVEKDASSKEIKRAYRRLAKEYHPDLNPGDEAAETAFKEVNLAYEVLSDDTKRKNYDLYGEEGLQEGFSSGGFGGFGDIFGDIFDIFGGGFSGNYGREQANAPTRGGDLRGDLLLDFKEAIFGTKRQVTIRRKENCATCEGTGAKPGTESHRCTTCQGTGQVRQTTRSPFGQMVRVVPCSDCQGTGIIIDEPCSDCHGVGQQMFSRTITVNIPAGVDNKSIISLKGEGNHGENGGPPGDLYIYIAVKDDPIFRRRGKDIYLTMPISYMDAVLGAKIQVPTLEGMEEYTIPSGTQGGTTFTISGQGVPPLRGGSRGDLYFTTDIIIPTKLSDHQKKLLEELRENSSGYVEEERKGFFDRMKEWIEDITE